MTTRVAAIQTQSTTDFQRNIDTACQMIQQAASEGAALVVIPENFATLGLNEAQKWQCAEDFQAGPIQQQMANSAKENQIWLVAGTLPIKDPNSHKIFASSLLYDPKGNLAGRYDKIHLFDVTVEGIDEYRESAQISAGDQIQVIDTPIGKIGLSICYDIRFPELFRSMMRKGVDMIALPSAFTIPTGKAHWEILVRARAIENLCFVIAAGEAGFRSNGLGTYGHSLIVGPWGEVLATMEMGQGILVADLDLDRMRQLRKEFPALTHARKLRV